MNLQCPQWTLEEQNENENETKRNVKHTQGNNQELAKSKLLELSGITLGLISILEIEFGTRSMETVNCYYSKQILPVA